MCADTDLRSLRGAFQRFCTIGRVVLSGPVISRNMRQLTPSRVPVALKERSIGEPDQRQIYSILYNRRCAGVHTVYVIQRLK